MVQIGLGVIAGFFGWMIAWFGGEKIISAVWPEGFGVHQSAFQAAIENKNESGGEFRANTTMLLIHIVLGSSVSVMSGFIAALVAGETMNAPLVLGLLLVGLGVLKAVMSWKFCPIWYHGIYTAMLLPAVIVGSKL